MPANFPEVWLQRVIRNLTSASIAPWLDGIPELDTEILRAGSGTESELNLIHIPRSTFEPEVLINNTAYPIALQAYTDDEVVISLDKYQTLATTVSDDKIMGASYPVIDGVTNSHVRSINGKKYRKAAHAIAPASNTATTPVIAATGAVVNGLATLTYADLVALKDAMDSDPTMQEGVRRLVLCPRHWNDLLRDRANFGDKLVNYNTGMPAPMIAGFELHQYTGNPLYTNAGVKKAFGAVKAAGDREASFAFVIDGVAKKTGDTKQYFDEAAKNPTTQANTINYRHYFIAVPFQAKSVAAIY